MPLCFEGFQTVPDDGQTAFREVLAAVPRLGVGRKASVVKECNDDQYDGPDEPDVECGAIFVEDQCDRSVGD